MRKFIVLSLLLAGLPLLVLAGSPPPAVPEINPASASSALAVVGGAFLILRARRRK